MKVQLFLRKIALGMQKSKFTKLLYRILSVFGLIRLKHDLLLLWFHKHPTQKMINEKKVFLEHSQELNMVYDFLEDDESRSVYENVIKFRATSALSCFKKCIGKDSLMTQYLVPELQFSNHEIIVDCGAYNGDTAKRFLENIPGCRVIALEPDEKNFEALQQCELDGLKALKVGVWSENTTLRFLSHGGGTACGVISTLGDTTIEAKALDNIIECKSATYIKMDIEGIELEALKGAANIIKKMKPKLAICIYHKPQDFFEIPLYIKKLNPDYKLYVHQHGDTEDLYETVLYAV